MVRTSVASLEVLGPFGDDAMEAELEVLVRVLGEFMGTKK
jgi:hypothetical protein